MSIWNPTVSETMRFPALAAALARVADAVSAWGERARQRRDVLGLPDHLLKDIGISRADAEAEAMKPFWRP